MARCPRCGKKFKDDARVLRHITQPRSACKAFALRLVRISRKVDLQSERNRHQTVSPNSSDNTPTTYTAMNDNLASFDQFVLQTNDQHAEGPAYPDAHNSMAEVFAGAASTYGRGQDFMDKFDADQYAHHRTENLFYPFASRQDWEIASWLGRANLSLDMVDGFLSLELVRKLPISFRTARMLRSRIEMLPKGPEWHGKPWPTQIPTKFPIFIYYRDAIACLEDLYRHPLLKDSIRHEPFRIFSDATRLSRKYTEWLSGDVAWKMQTQLPQGATLLGTILSSDGTNISALTGGRTAHPLLLSLANIDTDCRMRASNRAFLLLAILPEAHFIAPTDIRRVLRNRLFHEAVDFVVEPLKIAARIGIMMSDPVGNLRYCFTPLAAFIADTPEERLVACVANNASPFTMAFDKQFGDPFRHEPRTASTTLAQLAAIRSKVDPGNLAGYIKEASDHRLNGVDLPFWRNWAMAEPSTFLTPEPLHHLHKFFWDHETKWCIYVLTAPEIDFRFNVLQPRIGFRHFDEGISKLKQVTGRVHRDVQRYMISVIAGGAAPRNFVISLRALMDFRYLSQAPEVDEVLDEMIADALKDFHTHKAAIIEAGARRGKKKKLGHFNIPKLELFQSMAPSIRANGANIQFSADVTEHAHITEIKEPADLTNGQRYEEQICRYLDRLDKIRRFELATSIRDGPRPAVQSDEMAHSDGPSIATSHSALRAEPNALLDNVQGDIRNSSDSTSPRVNYFQEAAALLRGEFPTAPKPFRTFSAGTSAFHLNSDATYRLMTVESVAETFGLPDLRLAIAHYLQRCANGEQHFQSVGNRTPDFPQHQMLPFNKIQVWTRVRVQTVSFFNPHQVLSPETLETMPPSTEHPQGKYDSVLVNVDPAYDWPKSGISGHIFAQIRLIMRLVPHVNLPPVLGMDRFIAYVQRFDIVPRPTSITVSLPRRPQPDPVSGMYLLKRSTRPDGSRKGGIVPLSQCRVPIELTPRFHEKADPRLTKYNSLEISSEYWVDKYFHKELFWGLHLTRH